MVRQRRRLRIQTLEDRRLLAAQVVNATPSSDTVFFEDNFTVDLQYEVSDPLPGAPVLFGLHVHYNSSEIQFVDQSMVLQDGLVAVEDREETLSDQDPNTDRVWTVSFVDVVNGFPRPETALPALLARLEFQALRRGGLSPLNFTADTSAGYDFDGSSIAINITEPTFVVTDNDDSPSAGLLTLRDAVTAANAAGEPATIRFAEDISSVSLTGDELVLTNDVEIVGTGADQLTLSAANNSRLFNVQAGTSVQVSGLTIADGSTVDDGGAISNSGILRLESVRVVDSTAGGAAGGILNLGLLEISSSEISGNTASGGTGGGLAHLAGSLTMVNSTISNNIGGAGGGVRTSSSATIRNSTIAFNTSNSSGGGIFSSGGTTDLFNTIVVGNTVSGVVQDVVEAGGTINPNSSLVGGTASQIVNSTLAFAGARTRTHALANGSPAIDQGENSDAIGLNGGQLLQDQRGRGRFVGSSVDIGAVEFAPDPGMTVTLGSNEIEEGGSSFMTVVLTAAPASSVVVGLTSNKPADAVPRFDRVVFGPGNWDVPQTVPIDAPDDADFEGDKTAIVTVAVVDEDSDDVFDSVGSQSFTFNTVDDEGLGIVVEPTSGLTTSEAGGSATFTVVLDKAPSESVTIGVSSSDPSEGTASTNSLVFTPQNFSTAQTVTVSGTNDSVVDGTIGYSIILDPAVTADTLYSGFDPEDVLLINEDDDVAGITVTPLSGLETSEAGGAATFTVVLDSLPTDDVTIGVSSNNTNEGTISTSELTFTSANGLTPQTVTVTGVNDDVVDGSVGYSVVTAAAVSDDGDYNGLNPDDVAVSNTDDDTASVIVTPATGLSTSEGGGTATFTVALSSQPTADVTIALSSDNTGEGTIEPTQLTFSSSNGTTPQTVTITGVDDGATVDGTVEYNIITAAANSNDSNYDGIDPVDVQVSNADNDAAGITVTPVSGLATSESGDSATFSVALNSLPSADVTISISSSNTDEGTVSTSQLTFTSENGTTPQTVTVTGVEDDATIDGEISYQIVTGASVSTDSNYSGINPPDVTVVNSDNDVAGFTVTPVSGLVTDEDGGRATFTVALNTLPTADVTIGIRSDNTNEGTTSTSFLTFSSMTGMSPQSVTITGVDDDAADGNVSFGVITEVATSTDPNYDGLNPEDVSVTNNDNDTAAIIVTPESGLVTSEAGGAATFTVVLGSVPNSDVSIELISDNLSEGTVSTPTLLFTPNNALIAQTVTVTGVNDNTIDGDAVFRILTVAAVSSDANYSGLDAADVSVTNTDDDIAGITVSPITGLSTSEAGGSATFAVSLDTLPSDDVTIAISSSDTSEGTVEPASLTFTPSNGMMPQTVTITGADDGAVADGHVIYQVLTGAASSNDVNYDGIDASDVTVVNADNDSVGVIVTPATGLVTTESGGSATFEVALTTLPTSDVTIALTSDNEAEGTLSNSLLTFTPGNGTVAQTVTVTGVDDGSRVDGDIDFTIVTASTVSADDDYNDIDPPDVTVTNSDNDTAGVTVTPVSGLTTSEDGTTATFTVALDTLPSADVTIAISSNNLDEGVVSSSLLTFTSSNGTTAQTITITGVDDDVVDGASSFQIVTGVAQTSDSSYSGIDPADVTVSNADNDTAEIVVSPTSALTTTEGGGTASFTVALSTLPSADVTIMLLSDNLMEGTVSPASLIFTRENALTPQTVTVTGVDDSRVDGPTDYSIITTVASSDSDYSAQDPADVLVTNADNDVAGITITPTSGLSTSEVGGTATFTVALDTLPSADVTIGITSDDTDEGIVSSPSLTFTSVNGTTPQTITITGVDDGAVADGHVNYTIVTSAAASGDANYDGIDPADVSVVNADDDTIGVIVSPAAGLNTTESGGTATFDVSLTTLPTADVTIALASSDTDEGTVVPSFLTFTSVNGTTSQTVTITGVDDQAFDGTKPYSIVLAPAESADSGYDGFDPVDVSVENIDDDVPGVTVSPVSGLTTTEAGGSATFEVLLDTLPASDVIISLVSNDPTEGTVSPSALTFTNTNGTTPQTVTVTGVDDDDVDDSVGYTILVQPAVSADLNYDGIDPSDVTVVNSDNDDLTLLDFGDLADPTFLTLLANDGPRHSLSSLVLGGLVDSEADGAASALADGDGLDDDGVSFNTTILASSDSSTQASLMVESSAAGKLDAWIDANGNGSFDPEEHLGGGDSFDLVPGQNIIPFVVPLGAASQLTAAARFRLSSAGGLLPTGLAADGEVEDYVIEIVDGQNDPDIALQLETGSDSVLISIVDDEIILDAQSETLLKVPLSNVNRAQITASSADTEIVLDLGSAIPAGGIELDGGMGANSLLVIGTQVLDFTQPAQVTARNIAGIDLRDSFDSRIVVDAAAVTRLALDGPVTVIGDQDDTIGFADADDWRMGATSIEEGRFLREVTNVAGGAETLSTDLGRAWQNVVKVSDVNNNGSVTAGDALVIINELSRRAFSTSDGQVLMDPLSVPSWPGTYYDQNGDDRATALDALRVINELSQLDAGSGESVADVAFAPGQHNGNAPQITTGEAHAIFRSRGSKLAREQMQGVSIAPQSESGEIDSKDELQVQVEPSIVESVSRVQAFDVNSSTMDSSTSEETAVEESQEGEVMSADAIDAVLEQVFSS